MSKPARKRHVSHDGTIREYDFNKKQWILIDNTPNVDNTNAASKPTLALEGRIFNINQYFPHLYTKDIMNSDKLSKYQSKFKINKHSLYIGNMINNELKVRSSNKQQHGDTGGNVWDTSIVFSKCLEYNSIINKNINNNLLNITNKNVLELGTGTGFVGLSAILCNAKHVYLTDLKYCIKNIDININKNKLIWNLNNNQNNNNNLDDMKCNNINPFDNVTSFELDWSNCDVSIFKFNQINNKNLMNIDMIIGSDVIWVQELVPILVKTLNYLYDNILNKQNGIIVIGEQIRSKVVSELFWNSMKLKGFNKIKIDTNKYHPDFISNKIDLWIATKHTFL